MTTSQNRCGLPAIHWDVVVPTPLLACLQNVFKCGWGLSASTIKIITYLHIYLINAQHINFLQSMNKNVYTMLTLRCCGYFNSDSCCYSIAKLYHLLCHVCNFPHSLVTLNIILRGCFTAMYIVLKVN